MYWLFREVGANEVETEITQRDQFRNDEVNLADTLVREAVQNSLDAQNGDLQVRVRFRFVDGQDGLDKDFLGRLLDGQVEHAIDAGLDIEAAIEKPPRALVIEDFGTVGLTGKSHAKDDGNFSDFWRRHGKSHKTGKSGGRWGLGKLVYSYSSRVGAFFGLTRRADDEMPLLMGQTVLNTHVIDGVQYAPHGFFANEKDRGPEEGLQIPVSDNALLAEFEEKFHLERKMSPGLSVVIPYPRDEIEVRAMIEVGVSNYFFPVLTDQLVLEFDGLCVDGRSLREIALEHAGDRIENAQKLFDFVQSAHACPRDQMLVLDTDWYGDWKLTEDDFSPELLDTLRDRYARHELIGLTLRVDIKRKDGSSKNSSYDLYLKSDPSISRGQDLYVRGGITIPGESKFRHRKAFGALVAKDGDICEFLGDAENASHTKWNGRAEKLTGKYRNAPQTLSAIRNSLVNLCDALSRSVEEEVEDALLDFFWTPSEAGRPKPKGTKTSKPKVPKLRPAPKPFQLKPHKGGFRVVASKEAKDEDFPLECVAVAAYDVPSGNPFKNWEAFDFELGKSKGIPLAGRDVELKRCDGNTVRFVAQGPHFELRASGFDPERDLIVRLETGSPS